MRCNFQKVLSKHWVIRNFTEAKHCRLSKVDHQPDKNNRTNVYCIWAQQQFISKMLHKVSGSYLMQASNKALSCLCCIIIGRRSFCKICPAPSCWRTSRVSSSWRKYLIKSFILSANQRRNKTVGFLHYFFQHLPLENHSPKQSASLW